MEADGELSCHVEKNAVTTREFDQGIGARSGTRSFPSISTGEGTLVLCASVFKPDARNSFFPVEVVKKNAPRAQMEERKKSADKASVCEFSRLLL